MNLKFCDMIASKYRSKATSLNLKIPRETGLSNRSNPFEICHDHLLEQLAASLGFAIFWPSSFFGRRHGCDYKNLDVAA